MPAAKLDLYLEQGASYKRILTIKDADGNPLDLTGESYAGQIKNWPGDGTVLATFLMVVQDQTSPTTKGQVAMSLTSIQTASIATVVVKDPTRELSTFAYDVERTLADASKDRILEGLVSFSPEVTT